FSPVRTDSVEHIPDSQDSFVGAALGVNATSSVTQTPSRHTSSSPPLVVSACSAATSTLIPAAAPTCVHACPVLPAPESHPSTTTITNAATGRNRTPLRRKHRQPGCTTPVTARRRAVAGGS